MTHSATPAEHADSPITRAGALMDAAASLARTARTIRTTHQWTPIGEALLFAGTRDGFDLAWRVALPQLKALARRACNGDRTTDIYHDVLSEAARKTWRSVQTGYHPTSGYEAILPSNVQRAAANVFRFTQKHRDNPMVHLDLREDPDDEREHWLAVDDGALEAIPELDERAQLRRRLDRAARRAHTLEQPLAARILTAGIADSVTDTARALDASAKDIAASMEWIRRETYALLVCSDQRFLEHVQEVKGMSLFDAMAVSA